MGRMNKMTPDVALKALKIMQRINAHPCARIFLVIPRRDGVESMDLSTISANILTNQYQTVGEWRRDMREIVTQTNYAYGKDTYMDSCAKFIHQLFEKEYRKFTAYSSTAGWMKLCNDLTVRLNDISARMSSHYATSVTSEMALCRNQCKVSAVSTTESRVRRMTRKETAVVEEAPQKLFPYLCSPIEPDWISETETEDEDDEGAPFVESKME